MRDRRPQPTQENDLATSPEALVATDTGDEMAVSASGEVDPVTHAHADSVAPDGTIKAGKLAGKSMWAAIWIVAVPVLLQQLMQACVGMVDKLLAGQLPKAIVVDALDGIGLGTFVGWFIMIAMTGLGVGGQVIIARAMGSGDRHDAGAALGQSVTLSLLWGAVVGVLLWFAATPLAQLASLTPEATHWCEVYVRTIAVGMPFCGLMSVGTMCLHGAGESAKPLYISVLVNIVNVLGSWFISGADLHVGSAIVSNPFPHDPGVWGVFGIAAGTTLCYVVGGVATLVVLLRGVKDLRLDVAHLRVDTLMAWRIVRVGVPNFFEGFVMWAVQLVVMKFIGVASAARELNGLAKGGLVGAHTIAVQWESFSFLPGFAMGTAAGAVAGQYLGAGSPRLARKAIWACTFVGMAIMGSLGIVFMTAGTFLTSLISTEPVHLEVVPQCLFTCGVVQVFFALAMVVRNGLRGVGDAKWLLLITMGSCCLIRVPLAYLFGVYFALGLPGIWIGLCVELVTRGLFFLARFLWGDWARIRV
ncbi:MAG: MATE family efflux transporter [Phycisphaerae bacterium]|nr:MATE family efflux transporter [Phycisphaerae bacterium]